MMSVVSVEMAEALTHQHGSEPVGMLRVHPVGNGASVPLTNVYAVLMSGEAGVSSER